MIVVTAANAKYGPGVKALHNSIKRNCPDGAVEFWCLAYGDEDFINDLRDYGINVKDNPPFPPGTKFPTGGRWHPGVWDRYPDGMGAEVGGAMEAMYARILIPKIWPDEERVLWIDADEIVHQHFPELYDLDFQGKSLTAVALDSKGTSGNFLSKLKTPYPGCGTATNLFNVPVWNRNNLTEKCIEIMNTCDSGEMLAVVQSVMILAVEGDFLEWGWEYQHEIKHKPVDDSTKIYHFSIMVPWDDFDMSFKPPNFRSLVDRFWRPYA